MGEIARVDGLKEAPCFDPTSCHPTKSDNLFKIKPKACFYHLAILSPPSAYYSLFRQRPKQTDIWSKFKNCTQPPFPLPFFPPAHREREREREIERERE
jgi:hypothetical protein